MRHCTCSAVHIGDADGKIAVWLNEQGARDVADAFTDDDLFRLELLEAIERAYPDEEAD